MTWFTAGTIAIVSGSDAVTGTGTAWNAQQILPGFALFTAAGVLLGEIETVNSPTSLTLVDPVGATVLPGTTYKIVPTRGSDIAIYDKLAQLVSDYASVRDNAGQGMFGDGSAAAPGMRFVGDQDSGIWRPSANAIAIATGGVDRIRVDANGNVGVGAPPSAGARMYVRPAAIDGVAYYADNGTNSGFKVAFASGLTTVGNDFGADLALQTNNAERMRIAANGDIGVGTAAPTAKVDVVGGDGSGIQYRTSTKTIGVGSILGDAGVFTGTGSSIVFFNGTKAVTIDGNGNLLVNASSPVYSGHVINKSTAAGNAIVTLASDTTGMQSAVFLAAAAQGWNGADAAQWLGKQANGRSSNAAGSVNASGADFAEYLFKATGCGEIAKGDVCGIDADGKLVTSWAASLSFVIKSLEPGFVGNDIWGGEAVVGPRPQGPAPVGPAPIAPVAPPAFEAPEPVQGEGESEAGFAVRLYIWGQAFDAATAAEEAYETAAEAFPALLADWEAQRDAFTAAQTQFTADLAAWKAVLEASRTTVDRIAFSGQVPANVTGPFAVGDYVLPAEGAGDTITAIAVPDSEITFAQYRRRIGRIWAIREGRAWIDVQHG